MAQVRFQIGVLGAGSAARDAEASREHFSSLRPEAGSAARSAEEERRAIAAGATPQRRMATIRVQGRTSQTSAPSVQNTGEMVKTASQIEESSISGAATAPYPDRATQTGKTAAPASGRDYDALPHPTPLQTAAAKVRSLFRSVFSEPAASNETI